MSKKLVTTPTSNPPTPDQKDWTEADVPSHILVRYIIGTFKTKLRKAMVMPIVTVLSLSGFSGKQANHGTGTKLGSGVSNFPE